jgi:lysophosphatidate acyltransferase
VALSHTVFIDRANSKAAISTFDSAAQTIRTTRQNVFIFPEGTRSYSRQPDMLPFKKGAFHLAVQAQVPIIPVVAANYSHILDIKKMKFVPGTIPVRVLKPVPTKGLTAKDVPALCERVREVMLQALQELEEVKMRCMVENGSTVKEKVAVSAST